MTDVKVLVYTSLYDTGSDYDRLPYAKHTVAINEAYCEQQGYDFKVLGLPEEFPDRPRAWLRVWHAREQLKEYDFILFVDGDAFFIEHQRGIDHLISKYFGNEEMCLLFAPDQKSQDHVFHASLPNAGVFLVRNSEKSVELIEEWWNVPDDDSHNGKLFYDSERYLDHLDTIHHHPYEQLAAWFVMDRHLESIGLTDDYRELNGLDGNFIRHLIQVPDQRREHIAREFYSTIRES